MGRYYKHDVLRPIWTYCRGLCNLVWLQKSVNFRLEHSIVSKYQLQLFLDPRRFRSSFGYDTNIHMFVGNTKH